MFSARRWTGRDAALWSRTMTRTIQTDDPAPNRLIAGIKPYVEKAPLAAFFLGVSSGFPYALLAATLTNRLSDAGVQRREISAFALVLLIYSIKWAWAPIVDRLAIPGLGWFGQRRSWLWLAGVTVAAATMYLGSADPAGGTHRVLLAAILLALAASTMDVVIDAYRIELLRPDQLGAGSGMSQYGWRIGAFVAASIALYVASRSDWTIGYWACVPLVMPALLISLWAGEPAQRREREWPQRATRKGFMVFLIAIPIVLALASLVDQLLDLSLFFRIALIGFIYPLFDLTIRRAHDIGWSGHLAWLLVLPAIAATVGIWEPFVIVCVVVAALLAILAIKPGDAGLNRFGEPPAMLRQRNVVGPMVEFFRRSGAWLIFLFVLVHKIGDTMANLMIRDLLVSTGFSKADILWGDVWVGFISLLIGIFVGGVIYARLGLKRSVLISLILMGVSNFSFAALAGMGKSIAMLAFTMGFENFASGVGGVTVVALLSAVCNLRFTATQFAMLSAAAAIVGRLLTGTLAGRLIDQWGYIDFYLFTTAAALPGILLFWIMMRTGLVDDAIESAGNREMPQDVVG